MAVTRSDRANGKDNCIDLHLLAAAGDLFDSVTRSRKPLRLIVMLVLHPNTPMMRRSPKTITCDDDNSAPTMELDTFFIELQHCLLVWVAWPKTPVFLVPRPTHRVLVSGPLGSLCIGLATRPQCPVTLSGRQSPPSSDIYCKCVHLVTAYNTWAPSSDKYDNLTLFHSNLKRQNILISSAV